MNWVYGKISYKSATFLLRRLSVIKQDWKSFQSLPAIIILVYCIGSNMGYEGLGGAKMG
jgi:hypothetical protein